TSRCCLYCGASLSSTTPEGSAASAAPSPSANPASPPIGPRAIPARPAYVPRPRTPDYVGLFGVAFLFLVLGIVFFLNGNLLTELRRWWEQILAGRGAFRPPEGVITSSGLFSGLLGVANFGVAFLRWFFTRSRVLTLGAPLAGQDDDGWIGLVMRRGHGRRGVHGGRLRPRPVEQPPLQSRQPTNAPRTRDRGRPRVRLRRCARAPLWTIPHRSSASPHRYSVSEA